MLTRVLQVAQQVLLTGFECNPINSALPAQQFEPGSLRVSFVMAKAWSLSGREAGLTASSAPVPAGDYLVTQCPALELWLLRWINADSW